MTDYTSKLQTLAPSIKNYFSSPDNLKETSSIMSNEYSNGVSRNNLDNPCSAWKNKTINLVSPVGENINNSSMLPIISVTPQSPGTKYNGILEDSLYHLQSIRETVQQMKNPSTQNKIFGSVLTSASTVICERRR